MSYHQPQLPAWYASILTFRVRAPVRSPYSHMYAEKVWYDVWRDAAQVGIEAFFQWCPSLRVFRNGDGLLSSEDGGNGRGRNEA